METVKRGLASPISLRFDSQTLWCTAVLGVVGFTLLYPLFLLLRNSFQVAQPNQEVAFGLANWVTALTEPGMIAAILNTARLTLVLQLISFPVAIFIVWLLARTDLPGRDWIDFFFWIAFFAPSLPITLGWILLLDPDFAEVWAKLVPAYYLLSESGLSEASGEMLTRPEAFALAGPAAARAVALAPDLPESWVAMALHKGRSIAGDLINLEEAEAAYEKALALDPNNLSALEAYAAYNTRRGRHSKASELYDRGDFGSAFFLSIRTLSGKEGVGVILVGGEGMENVRRRQGQRLNKFREMRIGYIDRDSQWSDFVELVRHPVTEWADINDIAVTRLYEASAGNPFFTKFICGEMFKDMIKRRDAYVGESDALRAISRAVSARQVSGHG